MRKQNQMELLDQGTSKEVTVKNWNSRTKGSKSWIGEELIKKKNEHRKKPKKQIFGFALDSEHAEIERQLKRVS